MKVSEKFIRIERERVVVLEISEGCEVVKAAGRKIIATERNKKREVFCSTQLNECSFALLGTVRCDHHATVTKWGRAAD